MKASTKHLLATTIAITLMGGSAIGAQKAKDQGSQKNEAGIIGHPATANEAAGTDAHASGLRDRPATLKRGVTSRSPASTDETVVAKRARHHKRGHRSHPKG